MKTILCCAVACFLLVPAMNAQVILSENFDETTSGALPLGWTQASTSAPEPGWYTRGTTTFLYYEAIPVTSIYAMVDDKDNNQDNRLDKLLSPVFSLAGTDHPYLSYDFLFDQYFSFTAVEAASVIISTDGGSTWNELDSMYLDYTLGWHHRDVSLAAYEGYTNCQIAFVYSDDTALVPMMGVAIDNISVYNAFPEDIVCKSAIPDTNSLTAYVPVGDSIVIGGMVYNKGIDTIFGFTANYSVDGGAAISEVISGVSIPEFDTFAFSFSVPYTVPSVNGHVVKVWVTVAGDGDNSNDTANSRVYGTAFTPVKKLVFEDCTGTWCGWCPRGTAYMDSLKLLHSDSVTLISVHDAEGYDQMAVPAYDTFMMNVLEHHGYPTIVVDRRELYDPYNILPVYDKEKNYFGFADISIGDITTTTTTYTIPITVKPAIDLNGDYRVCLVTKEDSVHKRGYGWSQNNDYSYDLSDSGINLTDITFNYDTLHNPIADSIMYYNYVARAAMPDVRGEGAMLPAAMEAGNEYNYTFTGTYDTAWHTHLLTAAVLLIRGRDSSILNSRQVVLPPPALNVARLNAGEANFVVYPNPANNKIYASYATDGPMEVQARVYDMLGAMVCTMPCGMVGAGKHVATIDVHSLAPGMYMLCIQANNNTFSYGFSVVR